MRHFGETSVAQAYGTILNDIRLVSTFSLNPGLFGPAPTKVAPRVLFCLLQPSQIVWSIKTSDSDAI